MRYPVNKIITMKKVHACGFREWEVVKSGALVRLKCLGCMREITLLPSEIDKKSKK